MYTDILTRLQILSLTTVYNDKFLINLDLLGSGLSLSEFVEQLSNNFIALYLHCFSMNLERFLFK